MGLYYDEVNIQCVLLLHQAIVLVSKFFCLFVGMMTKSCPSKLRTLRAASLKRTYCMFLLAPWKHDMIVLTSNFYCIVLHRGSIKPFISIICVFFTYIWSNPFSWYKLWTWTINTVLSGKGVIFSPTQYSLMPTTTNNVLLAEWLACWTSTQSTRVQFPVWTHDWFGFQYNRRSSVPREPSLGT